MKALRIRLTPLDPWHAGSGEGRGATIDATPVRTPDGLPYLPGKSLRGVLRDALRQAEAAERVEAGTVERLFGSEPDAGWASGRREGVLRVSNATADREVVAWLASQPDRPALAATLFRTLGSTAIDEERGTAARGTLRVVEVAHPLPLEADIHGPDEDAWPRAISEALRWVRGIGAHRHRGLGRVEAEVVPTPGGTR